MPASGARQAPRAAWCPPGAQRKAHAQLDALAEAAATQVGVDPQN
jgi:hypothetical protein